MSSNSTDKRKYGRAEGAFRDAFERLKSGAPLLLPKGTPVSQNNVAKEAGLDSSALKKARFPELVLEIQNWLSTKERQEATSPASARLAQRNQNRDLRQQLNAMKEQRDAALGLLAEADAYILALTMENTRLQSQVAAPNNVVFLGSGQKKVD